MYIVPWLRLIRSIKHAVTSPKSYSCIVCWVDNWNLQFFLRYRSIRCDLFRKNRVVRICRGLVKGNHRIYSCITSSLFAITMFLHALITYGVFTRKYKRVAFKINTSYMMNENMLVNHYVEFLNSFTRLEHVFELKEVKLISQISPVYLTSYENLNR